MKFNLLQVFRGMAAILVMLYHLIAHIDHAYHYQMFGNFFRFGLIGVDFFFVLSGFIITYVHFIDLKGGGDWLLFFKKRFVRIYPLYWLIALLSVAIFVFMTPNRLKEQGLTMDLTSPYIWWSLVQSFLLIPQKDMYLVGVAWTLSFEILFYLFFGLCIRFGYRLFKITSALWLLLIVGNQMVFKNDNFYVQFLLSPLIIEFFMGCVVAYLYINKVKISVWIAGIMLVGFAVLSLYVVRFDGLRLERTLVPTLSLGAMFSALTYLAVYVDNAFKNISYPAPLLLLGNASYSLYLFHQTFYSMLVMVEKKGQRIVHVQPSPFLISLIIISLTILGCLLIHRIIEVPLLKHFKAKLVSDNIIAKSIYYSS